MDRFINLLTLVFFVAMLATPVSAHNDDQGLHRLTTPVGGVAFEVVGQVTNFPPASPGQPATSQQYGYLTTIDGLNADQVFNTPIPTLQNETTARFTFFTDAITERVISNGRLRIVNRIGTTTIYLDDLSGGDFGNRDTFRDGVPILRMNYRQQVILDTGEAIPTVPGSGTFTVMNLLAVTDASIFEIDGERYQLGMQKDQFRQFYSGAPPTLSGPIGVFAGYAVAIGKIQSNKVLGIKQNFRATPTDPVSQENQKAAHVSSLFWAPRLGTYWLCSKFKFRVQTFRVRDRLAVETVTKSLEDLCAVV